MQIPRFYNSEDDFAHIHHMLKHYPCPFCALIGCLILHGFLHGYDEQNANELLKRGHRIFCSNRKNRNGCGRTWSILLASFLKGFTLGTHTLWLFLKNLKSSVNKRQAFVTTDSHFSQSTPYNLWKRLCINLSALRTYLLKIILPPLPESDIPEIQTIAHLQSAFESKLNPIMEFQLHFQSSFFSFIPPKSGMLRP